MKIFLHSVAKYFLYAYFCIGVLVTLKETFVGGGEFIDHSATRAGYSTEQTISQWGMTLLWPKEVWKWYQGTDAVVSNDSAFKALMHDLRNRPEDYQEKLYYDEKLGIKLRHKPRSKFDELLADEKSNLDGLKVLKLVESGDADAQFYLARYLLQAKKDTVVAVKLLQSSAASGHSLAQNYLAVAYEHGEGGLNKDYALAIKWHKKAAMLGHPQSQARLGFYHREGRVIPKDLALAYAWSEMAVICLRYYAESLAENNVSTDNDNSLMDTILRNQPRIYEAMTDEERAEVNELIDKLNTQVVLVTGY